MSARNCLRWLASAYAASSFFVLFPLLLWMNYRALSRELHGEWLRLAIGPATVFFSVVCLDALVRPVEEWLERIEWWQKHAEREKET